jgi:CubicO group peptidase (beta-lactamase class C family)
MRWILGTEDLTFTPGTDEEYSNINYLALDLIAEQESGQSLLSFIRQRIVTPAMWVPATEIQLGRTFRADQDPREPRYDHPGMGDSVFDNTPPPYLQVNYPYGTWSQEGLQGFGGLVASAATMLEFLRRYHAIPFAASFGEPIGGAFPTPGNGAHAGALRGVNTWMQQRSDSIYVFVAFNKRQDNPHYGADFYANHLAPLIDAVTTWPTATSDGFWVSTGGTGTTGTGGYHDLFASFSTALGYAQDGSKLRLRPGTTSWTGVLDKKLLLDAPLGSAVLGH